MSTKEEVQYVFKSDTSGFKTGIDNSKNSVDKLDSSVKKAGAGIAKLAVGVGAAIGTGVIALTTMSTKSFAEFEQLVGGVETLFKGSADEIKKYADSAYITSGLSANEYMKTVTSFSASLIQSLGGDTAKAAKIADMAIIDMSDNANKMGTSIDMLQNAYQGFAKGNFMMLDNLKLGYGGTKTEMERLLKDAEKISGIKYDISSFSDMALAINVIQTEMGITGTTAKEASETIAGSFSMTGAAFKNLLTGLGNTQLEIKDIQKLIKNLTTSSGTALTNVLPVIEAALQSLPELLAQIIPPILAILPGLLMSLATSIFDVTKQLFNNMFEGFDFSKMFTNLGTQLATALNTGFEFFNELDWDTLTKGFLDSVSTLFNDLWNGMMNFITTFDFGLVLAGLFNTLLTIMTSIIDWLLAVDWGKTFTTLLTSLITLADEWINNIVDFFLNIDWDKTLELLFKFFIGLPGDLIKGIQEIDWDLVLKSLTDFILGIGAKLASAVGSALNSVGSWLNPFDYTMTLNNDTGLQGIAPQVHQTFHVQTKEMDYSAMRRFQEVAVYNKGGLA